MSMDNNEQSLTTIAQLVKSSSVGTEDGVGAR